MFQWILSMPSSIKTCEVKENYVNLCTRASSKQHVNWSRARNSKDQSDIDALHKFFFLWFSKRNPFTNIPDLLSLFSGVDASDNVDCYRQCKISSVLLSNFHGMIF